MKKLVLLLGCLLTTTTFAACPNFYSYSGYGCAAGGYSGPVGIPEDPMMFYNGNPFPNLQPSTPGPTRCARIAGSYDYNGRFFAPRTVCWED